MAGNSLGYEILEQNKLSESNFCPVCSHPFLPTGAVLHLPNTQLGCSRVLCALCVAHQLQDNLPCPSCLQPLTSDSQLQPAGSLLDQAAAIKIKCGYCHKKLLRMDWTSHDSTCPEKIIPCPASGVGCPFRTPRQEMKHHTCPYQPLQPALQSINSHLQSLQHSLNNANERISTQSIEIDKLKGELKKANTNILNLQSEKDELEQQVASLQCKLDSEVQRITLERTHAIALAEEKRAAENRLLQIETSRLSKQIDEATVARAELLRDIQEFRKDILADLKRNLVSTNTPSSESHWLQSIQTALGEGEAISSLSSEASTITEVNALLRQHSQRLDLLESMIQPLSDELLESLGIEESTVGSDDNDDWDGQPFDIPEPKMDDIENTLLAEYMEAIAEYEQLRDASDAVENRNYLDFGDDELQNLRTEFDLLRDSNSTISSQPSQFELESEEESGDTLRRTPSAAMLEYLLSLPTDFEEPAFSKQEVQVMKARPPRPLSEAPSDTPVSPRSNETISTRPSTSRTVRAAAAGKSLLVHTKSGLKFGKHNVAVIQLKPLRPSKHAPELKEVKKERKKYYKDKVKAEKDNEKSMRDQEKNKRKAEKEMEKALRKSKSYAPSSPGPAQSLNSSDSAQHANVEPRQLAPSISQGPPRPSRPASDSSSPRSPNSGSSQRLIHPPESHAGQPLLSPRRPSTLPPGETAQMSPTPNMAAADSSHAVTTPTVSLQNQALSPTVASQASASPRRPLPAAPLSTTNPGRPDTQPPSS